MRREGEGRRRRRAGCASCAPYVSHGGHVGAQQRLVLLHRAHWLSLLCGGADSSSSCPTFSSPALEYARSVGFMSPILQRHLFKGIFSTHFLSFILLVLFTYRPP